MPYIKNIPHEAALPLAAQVSAQPGQIVSRTLAQNPAVSITLFAFAKGEENRHHVRLIRWLSLASVVLTAVLLVLNLRSAGLSEGMGRALNAALTVVSAPMMCANTFAVPLFLWGTLLTDTFRKK